MTYLAASPRQVFSRSTAAARTCGTRRPSTRTLRPSPCTYGAFATRSNTIRRIPAGSRQCGASDTGSSHELATDRSGWWIFVSRPWCSPRCSCGRRQQRPLAPHDHPRCSGAHHCRPGAAARPVGLDANERRGSSAAGRPVLVDTRCGVDIGSIQRDVPVVARLPPVPRRARPVERHRPGGWHPAHPAAGDRHRPGRAGCRASRRRRFHGTYRYRATRRGRRTAQGRRLDGDCPRRRRSRTNCALAATPGS